MRSVRAACVCSIISIFLSICPILGFADDDQDAATGGVGQLLPALEDVIFTGAANYKFPIHVPPGRGKGMTPALSVNYSSQRRRGWVGVGWDLDVGSIQQSTKWGLSYDQNGYTASMNGYIAELVQRPEWGASNTYGPKVENGFAKYLRNPSTGGWEVTAKDGTKYYYGSTAASRQDFNGGSPIFKWGLDTVVDTNGNCMAYTYSKPLDSQLYLQRIDYTGRWNGQTCSGTTNQVVFATEATSQDWGPSYATGYPVRTLFRLHSVTTYANSSIAKQYLFGYHASVTSSHVLLTSITPYGSDGSALPPTSFTYQQPTQDFTHDSNNNPPVWTSDNMFEAGAGDGWTGYYLTGDFNGDGRTDIVSFDYGSYIYYGPYNYSYNYYRARVQLSTGNGFEGQYWSTGTHKLFLDTYLHSKLWVGDFNGDGKSDLATVDTSGKIWVFISTGNGFIEPTQAWNSLCSSANMTTCANKATSNAYKYIRVGDFNGDGKTDMVSWVNATTIRMFISNGVDGFTVADWPCSIASSQFWLGDFNGDGKTDIAGWVSGHKDRLRMHLATTTTATSAVFSGFTVTGSTTNPDWSATLYNDATFGPLLWLGDFNGDGRTDIAAWVSGGLNLKMHLSTGSAFDRYDWSVPTRFYTDDLYGPLLWLGDFNGDGRTDVAAWHNGSKGKNIFIHRSEGTGFFSSQWTANLTDPTYLYPPPGTGDISLRAFNLWFGDFNGDGRTDIFSYGNHGLDQYGSMHMPDGPAPELLSSIADGLGGTTTITYKPSSAYNDNEDNRMPFIIQTVASKTVNDGNGVSTQTTYNYSGAYYDREEREFYGFNYVAWIDPASTTATQTWYLQKQADGIKSRYKGGIYAQDIRLVTWSTGGTGSGGSSSNGEIDGVCVVGAGGPCNGNGAASGHWVAGPLYKAVRNSYNFTTPYANSAFPFVERQDVFTCDGNCTEGTTITGGRQTATTFVYDGYGNLAQKYLQGEVSVSGDERCENTTYSTDGNLTSKWILNRPATTWITGAPGGNVKARSSFTYDGNGNLLSKTDALNLASGAGPTTMYGWDYYGNNTSITDPRGNPITIEYDTATNTYPVKTTYPYPDTSPFFTLRTWDYRYGKPLSETDFNNRTTAYTYDGFGRISTLIKPPDSEAFPTKAYSYENFGTVGSQKIRVVSKTEGTATTWQETYFDGLGRTISVKKQGPGGTPDPGPITTNKAYDARGLLSGQSLARFDNETVRWTTYAYDPLKRITQVTRPDGTYETSTYDRWKTTLIDANGHQRVRETDGMGRLTKVEEYTGTEGTGSFSLYASTAYHYDPLGNLVTTTDNAGNQTSIIYDPLSRKTSMTDPDMGPWSYQYDPNGNLTSRTDGKNQTINFAYDNLNRVIQKTYVGSMAAPVVYTYDEALSENPKGRTTTVADASGSTQFSYDERGRTKSTTKTIDGTSYTILTGYDSRDRVKSITYPGSSPETVSYVYDAAGNLTNVHSSVSPDYAVYTGFNALGQAGEVQYGNGVYTTYTYDITSTRLTNLTTVGTAPLQNLNYTYDNVGNIETLADAMDSTKTQTFQYDELDRLIQADSSSYGTSPTIVFSYDAIGNITFNTRVGAYTYTDPLHVHAVTQAGANQYTYDANGNMTGGEGRTFTWGYDDRPTSINGIPMVYDYQGKRVKKGLTRYAGDLYECTGAACTMYIFANGKRIARKAGASINYYHGDHLGSSSVVTGDSMAKVEEISYYPYGQTRTDAGAVNVRHKYTDQEWDSETGLYYYKARYYNPLVGRFISADTVVTDPFDPQNLNRYSYVINNPIRYADPTGHDRPDDCDFVDGERLPVITLGEIEVHGTREPDSKPNIEIMLASSAGVAPGVGPFPFYHPMLNPRTREYKAAVDSLNQLKRLIENALKSIFEGEDDKNDDKKDEQADKSKQPDQPKPPPYPKDPKQPPGPEWEWRGKGPPGNDKGAWYNPSTGESLHPDLNHPEPKPPHWDYTDPNGNVYPIYVR